MHSISMHRLISIAKQSCYRQRIAHKLVHLEHRLSSNLYRSYSVDATNNNKVTTSSSKPFHQVHSILMDILLDDELSFGQGTISASEEAAFLMIHYLNLPCDQPPITFSDLPVSSEDYVKMAEIAEERLDSRRPMAYLTNTAFQQGHKFYVDERVIIPRSYLSEIMFTTGYWDEKSKDCIMPKKNVTTVLDLCCGSGSLGILANKVFPNITSTDFIDISSDALEVANINVSMYESQVKNPTLYQGDLFKALNNKYTSTGLVPMLNNKPTYDLILANPPYVDARGMKNLPIEYQMEPSLAFDGGVTGVDIIVTILKQAKTYLKKDGVLLCEIGMCKNALTKKYPHIFVTRNTNGVKSWGQSVDKIKKAVWINTSLSKEEVFAIRYSALENL